MNILNMKIIKIDVLTIYFLLLLFLCGYIKVALIIFFIVLVHELGHVLVALIFRFQVLKVVIYPFGGMTYLKKDINTDIYKDLILASGGILMQLALFGVLKLLPFSIHTLELFYKYNITILVFNLLPIIPLDGSYFVKGVLNYFFSFRVSYFIYAFLSILFSVIYIFSNYWLSFNNYLLVILFVFKTYAAVKDYKYIQNKFYLERYLNDYSFRKISTKKGDIGILKLGVYQYFLEENRVKGEKRKLMERFDKEGIV